MELYGLDRTNRVVHCKRTEHDVYIGRPGPWGNPFPLKRGANERERIECLDHYVLWLVTYSSVQVEAQAKLKGKILGCWCAPRLCHGEPLLVASEGADVRAWWNAVRALLIEEL